MEKTLTFDERCINKNKHKKPISVNGINTEQIVLSCKKSYDNKYFIG